MEITEVGKALSNETRTKILHLLANGPLSAVQTFEHYRDEYEDEKHRESIYRELEHLVEVGLLAKGYNETEGQIEYELNRRELSIDLTAGTVEPHDDNCG